MCLLVGWRPSLLGWGPLHLGALARLSELMDLPFGFRFVQWSPVLAHMPGASALSRASFERPFSEANGATSGLKRCLNMIELCKCLFCSHFTKLLFCSHSYTFVVFCAHASKDIHITSVCAEFFTRHACGCSHLKDPAVSLAHHSIFQPLFKTEDPDS